MIWKSYVKLKQMGYSIYFVIFCAQLEARDNPVFRHLEQFEKIEDPQAAKTNPLSYPVPLSDLLPDDTGSFYRYNGSLTTAGCNEDVIWTVFDTPIAISERQVFKLI